MSRHYHTEPSAAAPQPKLGVFPAKTLRRKGFKKKTLSELGAFAGGISESETFTVSENLRKLRKL